LLIRGASNPQNNGLHYIYSVPVAGDPIGTQLGIYHEQGDKGVTFVTEAFPGGMVWRVYNRGERLRVINHVRSTRFLVFRPFGTTEDRSAIPINDINVELEAVVLEEARGKEGDGTVTVDVDRALIPTPPQSDLVTLAGTYLPDGWRLFNGTAAVDYGGYLVQQRLIIAASGAGDIQLQRDLRPEDVETYRGFIFRASFWVQQHDTAPPATEDFRIDFAFDGGAFVAGSVVPGSVSANPEPVLPTFIDNGPPGTPPGLGVLDPSLVQAQAEVPYNASSCTVRLVHVGSGAGDYVSIERCIVLATTSTGLFLSQATTPLSAHRAKFGEVLYVWSPEELADDEKQGLGLPLTAGASAPDDPGTIDNVVNAHGIWDRYDVSTYGGGGVPLNVLGAYDEVAWTAAALTNMELVVGTPARMSIVRPSAVSLVEGEELTLVAPSNAALAEVSIHEGVFPEPPADGEILYENGVPIPSTSRFAIQGEGDRLTVVAGVVTLYDANANFGVGVIGQTTTLKGSRFVSNDGTFLVTARPTAQEIQWTNLAAREEIAWTGKYRINGVSPWRFLTPAPSQLLQIASVAAGDPVADTVYADGSPYYNSTAVHTIDYYRMIRAEPLAFDLGASYTNYLWLVDAALYRRAEAGSDSISKTEQLDLRADYRATLGDRSDGIKDNMTVTKDTGLKQEVVAVLDWSLVDSQTVALDPGAFDPDAVYTITYQALVPNYPRPAVPVVEHRSSGVSLADVLLQAWQVVQPDELVNRAHRYHQLRVTISGVVDTRDIEVAGLGLRGINLYGTTPYAPGIIPP
jgi:hypothetical protein